MTAPLPIATRGDVRRVIQQAGAAAREMRRAGHRGCADLFDTLAEIARRRLDPEHEPAPDVHHGGEDIVGDLFDGKAA